MQPPSWIGTPSWFVEHLPTRVRVAVESRVARHENRLAPVAEQCFGDVEATPDLGDEELLVGDQQDRQVALRVSVSVAEGRDATNQAVVE